MTVIPVWFMLVPRVCAGILCAFGRTPAFICAVDTSGSFLSLAVSGYFCVSVLAKGPITGPVPGLYLDSLGAYLAIIISLLTLAASMASRDFMEHEAEKEKLGIKAWRIYYGLLNAFSATMLLVPISDNLGILWVAVEATTLSSAFLVGFHSHRHSVEAAWKYIILCSIGIAFALFGTILIYYAGINAGGGSLDWTSFMKIAPGMNPQAMKLAFLFAALGYGTKAGLAPMHTWLPDAHSQAPSPVSAVLSGVLLTSAFYALIRFYSVASACLGPEFPGSVLIFFGLTSLAIAVPFIIAARDYKRMLAYSSVEHMGFMAIGLGIGTPLALYGTLLHALCHALAKGLGFISAGRILRAFGTRKITKVSGIATAMPETGIPFFIAVLALAGLPPSGIFISEFLVLSSGFASGRARASFAALLLLAAAFAGLLYHAMGMSLGKANRKTITVNISKPKGGWLISATVSVVIFVSLGLWIPGCLDFWLRQMASTISGDFNG